MTGPGATGSGSTSPTRGCPVDFVGPETDLFDRATAAYSPGGYLDPAFDQDHAARWGNALGFPAFSVSDLVATYQPDVLVELLGINDLDGLGASVDTVDQELGQLVATARQQKPDVSVVLGALGSDWIPKVPEFNAQLPALAAQLDQPDSRVVAADPPHLVQDVDTYEFVHPSATGEVKIAADIADALSSLGVGPPATRPLPVVPNGPRDPAVLSVVPGEHSATLSWELPLGADRAYVEQRDLDAADTAWHRSDQPILRPVVSTVISGLVDGDRYRFRLRAAKYAAVAEDIASPVAQLRLGVPALVPSFAVRARPRGFRASWGGAELATSYLVTWWPAGHRGEQRSIRTRRTVRTVHHLGPRVDLVVMVRAVHGSITGPGSRQLVTTKR